MAPKRATPIEEPPAASSSSEEEEAETSSGEEDEGSSSGEEEEQVTPPQTQTLKPVPKKQPEPTNQKRVQQESGSESGSETGSGSGSESDSESERPNNATVTVKPIASKPMEDTPTKKPKSKLSTTSSPPAKSTAAKRGSETDRDVKDSKRAKKKDSEADGVADKSEDTKKQLFQRVWSPDDEIALLEGIIEFTEKKGFDPIKDMNAFFDFIKKSLHFDVSINQLKDKVWRLKKKFANAKKFSKPHDQKASDLANKIWSREGNSSGGADSSVKSNGKVRKTGNGNAKKLEALKAELGMDVANLEGEKIEAEMERSSGLNETRKFDISVGVKGMEDYVVKKGLDMLEGAKKVEMEEKWRKLHVAQLELFLQRNELVREQAKILLAAYKTETD